MLKYLIELKNRIGLLLITWISTMFMCYLYKEVLLFTIVYSHFSESSTLCYLIFTNVTEIFSAFVKIILFLSFQFMVFYFFYHCFSFITPALFYTEYFYVKFLFKILISVWYLSVLIANYLLIPLTWDFFLSFQYAMKDYFFDLHFEAKLSEYLNFYVSLCYISIFYFLTFTILLLCFNYFNSSFKSIKNFRKLYYYFFVVFSTLISPPDVFSQVIISLLTVIIYEVITFFLIFKFFVYAN